MWDGRQLVYKRCLQEPVDGAINQGGMRAGQGMVEGSWVYKRCTTVQEPVDGSINQAEMRAR
jgi:hypothetical protein